MVYIEGGTFLFKDVKIISTVNSFWLGKFPVTNEEYRCYCEDRGLVKTNFIGGKKNPVVNVNWLNAIEYCEWLSNETGRNYHLPLEVQWEFAAKGGRLTNGYKYSGGNSLYEVAWFWLNSGFHSHSVGFKKPNELGLFDMSGNVWEMCADFFSDDNYPQTNHEVINDPIGSKIGQYVGVRGGSFMPFSGGNCLISHSMGYIKKGVSNQIGFRIAMAD